ncbi:MAG: hypothetical protein ACFWTZ_09260 [Burkholderia sp.]|jgi:hypothetical protein
MSEKVYTDEAVPPRASLARIAPQGEAVPARYRKLIDFSLSNEARGLSRADLFYCQARIGEAIEEHEFFDEPFAEYFPVYADMSLRQLRTYFGFRTAVRQGRVRRVTVSYAFVYLYELINGIGFTDPEEGLKKFADFVGAWRRAGGDSVLERYARRWLRDFALFWNAPSGIRGQGTEPGTPAALAFGLADCFEGSLMGDESIVSALAFWAGASAGKTAFWRKHEALCRRVAADAWRLAAKRAGREELLKVTGLWLRRSAELFPRALVASSLRAPDHSIRISDAERFEMKDGQGVFVEYFPKKGRVPEIANFLRACENAARRLEGERELRAAGGGPEFLFRAAADARLAIARERREAANPVSRINLGALSGIRRDADETAAKLTVPGADDEEDFGAVMPPEPEPAPAEPPAAEPAFSAQKPVAEPGAESAAAGEAPQLSDEDRALAAAILAGEDPAAHLRPGETLSLAVNRLNEALFDVFGDAVFEMRGAAPAAVEDYAADLKELLGL